MEISKKEIEEKLAMLNKQLDKQKPIADKVMSEIMSLCKEILSLQELLKQKNGQDTDQRHT